LAPVYAQVADELRAVYSLAYYPKNQNFDGKWRRIQVRVKRTGVVLRTRNGYYAR
jgi:Ca-activated chloride channel family protein